jgi:hypothetical protein
MHARPITGDVISIAAALEGAGRELRALGNMTNQVQHLVSDLAIKLAASDPGKLRDLQTLDYVTQAICGVASFLEALAAAAPLDCHVNALAAARTVGVSELAARLSLASTRLDGPAVASGECDYFNAQA